MSEKQTTSDNENNTNSTPRCWVAVASADHVARGYAGGFMQVCHGKQGPLKRVKPDDLVVYYSPTFTYQKKDTCQSFAALGHVTSAEPYQVVMSENFMPYRHDVAWLRQQHCPIRPLLQTLSFTRDNPRWGYQFRLGLFEIPFEDMQVIAHQMGVELTEDLLEDLELAAIVKERENEPSVEVDIDDL